jgi:hypothetical protein
MWTIEDSGRAAIARAGGEKSTVFIYCYQQYVTMEELDILRQALS